MEVPFINEFRPPRGNAQNLAEGIRRIVAPNPSALTFKGTNTYIVGTRELVVIDPGPNMDSHLDAILSAVPPQQRISKILVTHSHLDHSGLARRLADETGAATFAFGDYRAGCGDEQLFHIDFSIAESEEGIDTAFKPDVRVQDGETIQVDGWTLAAIWTPGHIGNHLCFDLGEVSILFSGDHVMTWATTVVSPPFGSMTAYLASLKKLISRGQRKLLPGHGAEHSDGLGVMRHLVAHRRSRERQILETLGDRRLSAVRIAEEIYADLGPSLRAAASRNVFAHLLDMRLRGIVDSDGNPSASAAFHIMR